MFKRISMFLLISISFFGCYPIALMNSAQYFQIEISGKDPLYPIITMGGPYVKDGMNMVKLEQIDFIGPSSE